MASPEFLVTVEECPRCGVRLKRNFQQGDYVGKDGGICDFCGSKMYVRMIYLERPGAGGAPRARLGPACARTLTNGPDLDAASLGGSEQVPTAISSPSGDRTHTSMPRDTFLPTRATWPDMTDIPPRTNSTDSPSTTTQLSRNSGDLMRIRANSMLIARLPSSLSAAR
ncbi:MAG: hypothetical protein RXR82_06495 [Nitrososphaeria archaeon]